MADLVLYRNFLQNLGWTCSYCRCSGGGINCVNNKFKRYIINVYKTGIARFMMDGRVIASVPVAALENKMVEIGLMIKIKQ
jgi:hypothetical protein